MSALVFNCSPYQNRVALVEKSRAVELLIEKRRDSSLVGNIYKGRVTRILPGMQAAFVDIGLERAAFLYVGDIATPRGRHEPETTLSETRADAYQKPIQHLLTEGQEIMVQVAKEPIGTKGARVTNNVSIAGRHLVYMPTVEHVGVSRRIVDDGERARLKDILETLVPQGGGFVARTAAEGRSVEDLETDLEFLRQVWNDILLRQDGSHAPSTLYEEFDILLRAVRDLVRPELEEIVVDNEDEYERINDFMSRFMPRYVDRLKKYSDATPVFDSYGIEEELQRAMARQVWLPSGGYLIIDQTEALTAIDVNTGRFVGKKNLHDTILKTNIEASDEIVRQLRLRNIGGIIIIDFIDMEDLANRDRIFTDFALALESDPARSNITKISELGLLEMTRKRTREALKRMLSEPCFYCSGSGLTKSRGTVIQELFRSLMNFSVKFSYPRLCVRVNPKVAERMRKEDRDLFEDLQGRLGRRVEIEEHSEFHLEHFEFVNLP
jgi:ribonuclease G